jgi:ElaB/YqjD/DUF883 family membrane-anchored ribosome-binding protein
MFKSNGQVTKEKLLNDFNAVVADADRLLKSLTEEGGEQAEVVRAQVQQNLQVARERLGELQHATVGKTKAAARAADTYVHEHPWLTIGFTAAIGVLAGLLLNRR